MTLAAAMSSFDQLHRTTFMKTFSIETLGCRVNHYESQQIAQLLRTRGLIETDASSADLRVVHTCSVTMHAARESRQSVRRAIRLPLLQRPGFSVSHQPACASALSHSHSASVESNQPTGSASVGSPADTAIEPTFGRSRVVVTGCWATSDQNSAQAIPGVSAVLGHHQNMAVELDRLITAWQLEDARPANDLRLVPLDDPPSAYQAKDILTASGPVPMDDEKDNKWMIQAGAPAGLRTTGIKPSAALQVNQNLVESVRFSAGLADQPGTTSLPVLSAHQSGLQRAVLKVQDGCDAHCTYCIIPQLRPRLWSKPIDQAVEEAKALVAAGHCEIVLTGIFLGAYGQATALRRRQTPSDTSLVHLIEALCTRVTGLCRLRLSSIEPGDLTTDLLAVLSSHHQVMPHFHLPLQSGSDLILRRMNRQYSRDDFLQMVERVRHAFDRPALTTDVVVGFPGEDDAEFEQTVDVVKAAGFIHVHAFPYSPRPGTAAARWADQFIHGPVVGERLHRLQEISLNQSLLFRRRFLNQEVEIIIEQGQTNRPNEVHRRHGRCERYFDVWLDGSESVRTGQVARVRITDVTSQRTFAKYV